MFEMKITLHADETMFEFARALAAAVQHTVPEVKAPAEPESPPAAEAAAATPPAAVTPVPTTARTYTREEVSRAAASLLDAGKGTELVELLHRFGAQAITQLPEDKLGEFATGLRGMGAKI